MIGGFWNIRGTGKPGRKQALHDFISDYNLDFVGIQETKKMSFTSYFLKFISGHYEFIWNFLPANNTADGILVGFREDKFDIISCTCFRYCVAVVMSSKEDGFTWQLVVVYGTPYFDFKMEFIAELHEVMENSSVPTLLGGDFNLVRSSGDKSDGIINANWSHLFNDWINRWSLIDFKISNRSFTWSNNQDNLIMVALDRVLDSTDWEAKFPLTTIRALPKPISDHTPLILDSCSGLTPLPNCSDLRSGGWSILTLWS